MPWQFIVTNADVLNALSKLERTMGQVADALSGVKNTLDKAKGEILVKIGDLETKLANAGKLDAADLAAIQDLKNAAVDLDNVVPDAPVEPEPEPQPEPPVEQEPTDPNA